MTRPRIGNRQKSLKSRIWTKKMEVVPKPTAITSDQLFVDFFLAGAVPPAFTSYFRHDA